MVCGEFLVAVLQMDNGRSLRAGPVESQQETSEEGAGEDYGPGWCFPELQTAQGQQGENHPHTPGHSPNGHSHGSHDHHGHTHETKTPGPNGGRIVHLSGFHFEFFVEADREGV